MSKAGKLFLSKGNATLCPPPEREREKETSLPKPTGDGQEENKGQSLGIHTAAAWPVAMLPENSDGASREHSSVRTYVLRSTNDQICISGTTFQV